MGSGVQNVRFLRFFIVLGAGVILSLFIYASYNSSKSLEAPHMRNGPPPVAALTQSFRNHSNAIKDAKSSFTDKVANAYLSAGKEIVLGLNNLAQHDVKSNTAAVKHHRQPTIDVEAPAESELEAYAMLEERELKDQQFSDSNLIFNSSSVQSLPPQELVENNNNKIADSDFLIPTLNLQKFIENADKILKNMTTAPIVVKSLDKQLTNQKKNVEAKALSLPAKTVVKSNNLVKTNATTTTTTTTTTAMAAKPGGSNLDPTQGIPTSQIYESGHLDDELNIKQICPDGGSDIKLLILITSAQAHQEARLAIRQTWGHYGTRRDVAALFIVGRSTNETLNMALTQENFIYGDLIRGNFLDTYNNLTLKTISALEWVDHHCAGAKHILKTDDDMFINVPKLLAFLEKHAQDKRVIYGRLAKKWKPIRNKKSKYYVSPGQFAATIFPAFTTGPAYVLSSDIVHELYQRALQQTYLKLEDVFTTGIIAQQFGVKRVHVNEFLNRRIAFNPCNIRKTISVHMIKANEQFDLWKKLLDQSTKCK